MVLMEAVVDLAPIEVLILLTARIEVEQEDQDLKFFKRKRRIYEKKYRYRCQSSNTRIFMWV